MIVSKIQVSGVVAKPLYRKPITAGMVGVKVELEYTDARWEGLTKTVVFRSDCRTLDVLNAGTEVVIPAEVIAKPVRQLMVGVYGVDARNNLVIPTVWAELGRVWFSANPSGDTSTDPQLPVWAQLQEQIDDLKENGTGGGGGSGSDVLIVTADENMTASHTPAQIKAHVDSGGIVVAKMGDDFGVLSHAGSIAVFAMSGVDGNNNAGMLIAATVNADKSISVETLPILPDFVVTVDENYVASHTEGEIIDQVGLGRRVVLDVGGARYDYANNNAGKAWFHKFAFSSEGVPVEYWAGVDSKKVVTAEAITYEVPMAKPAEFGGIKADAATDDMTQPIGITTDGHLVTKPGSTLLITIDDSNKASHSSAEITQAASEGTAVTLNWKRQLYQLKSTTTTLSTFARVTANLANGTFGEEIVKIRLDHTVGAEIQGIIFEQATDDMTQPIGITETGKLVTAPSASSSSGSSGGNADLTTVANIMPSSVPAMGDNTTDDSEAIQALLDTKDYVYLPKGTYYIAKNPLKMTRDNCTFICDGTLIINTTHALELSASFCNIKIAHIKARWNGSWTEADKWKFTVSAIKLHAVTKSVMYNNIEVGFIERCINGFWFVPDGQGLGIAHNTITFRDVYAERGIYFAPGDQEYVFINGNHFYGGQLRGNHPIYTQKGVNQIDQFNGNTFNHIAMEGCQKPMILQFFYMNKFSDMRLASSENAAIVYPNPLIIFDAYSFGNTIETHATLGLDRIVDPKKETNRQWEHWLGNLYVAKALKVGPDDISEIVGVTAKSRYGYMIVDNEWHETTAVYNTNLDISSDNYAIQGRTFVCIADTNDVVITLPMAYRQRAATEFYVFIESITSPHTVTVMQDGVEIIPANVMTEVGLYKAELITSIGWFVTKVAVEYRLPEGSLPETKSVEGSES